MYYYLQCCVLLTDEWEISFHVVVAVSAVLCKGVLNFGGISISDVWLICCDIVVYRPVIWIIKACLDVSSLTWQDAVVYKVDTRSNIVTQQAVIAGDISVCLTGFRWFKRARTGLGRVEGGRAEMHCQLICIVQSAAECSAHRRDRSCNKCITLYAPGGGAKIQIGSCVKKANTTAIYNAKWANKSCWFLHDF